MVRVKNTKTVKKARVSKSNRRAGKSSKVNTVNKRIKKSKKTRQRGGNPVMISKLCASSKNGKNIGVNVSSAYIGELCSENDKNKSQSGGSGIVSGIVSNLFKAASLPLKVASGTFNKITGVDLTEVVSKKVNGVLNTNENIKSYNKSGDRETDIELSKFLSKTKL